jgi:2,3-dihydroxybenzoate decarboxylase
LSSDSHGEVQDPACRRHAGKWPGPTWSWTAETATHALRIVFGGVFDRFPRMRLILPITFPN